MDSRNQFLSDITITAVEGGTGYWAECRKYNHKDGENVTVELREEDNSKDDSPTQWFPINNAVIEKGIEIVLSDETKVHRSYKNNIRNASAYNDSCEIDAELADMIVQCAMLGDVVYG